VPRKSATRLSACGTHRQAPAAQPCRSLLPLRVIWCFPANRRFATLAAIVTMPFRILSLLLCLLVAGPMNALPMVAPGCGDAQVLEEQRTAGGTPSVRCAFGLELISQDRNGSVHYFGYDGQGTVRYLTTTANPPVVSDTYTHDAFGIQIASNGAGTANTYRYAGEQWDEPLGMYYLRARYYHPEVGRFWTMDTFEGTQSDPLSLHKYLYGADDPVNHIDPSGHEYNLITLNVANYQQQNMRASHGAGLSAGRATALNKIGTSIGITAWLLMNFMDVGEVQFETAPPQIPNQEQEEYKELRDPALGFQQYGQCVEYAEKVSQRRSRGRPLFVAYRLKPQYSFNLYAPWGSILSRLSGQRVADNGFHVGVVILGNVFDNYYSNVPLMTWPLLYEVIRPKIGVDSTVTLMRAHGEVGLTRFDGHLGGGALTESAHEQDQDC